MMYHLEIDSPTQAILSRVAPHVEAEDDWELRNLGDTRGALKKYQNQQIVAGLYLTGLDEFNQQLLKIIIDSVMASRNIFPQQFAMGAQFESDDLKRKPKRLNKEDRTLQPRTLVLIPGFYKCPRPKDKFPKSIRL